MDKEVWKDIKDYEGLYQISNYGNVKSLKRKYVPKDKLLKLTKGYNNYIEVRLSKGSPRKVYTNRVHVLVTKHFIGDIENGLTVNHKDGNKFNNHADNLEIISRSDNTKHAWDIKIYNQNGENSVNSKLSNTQVEDIRLNYKNTKISHNKLAIEYGVSRQTISNIINYKTYKNDF